MNLPVKTCLLLYEYGVLAIFLVCDDKKHDKSLRSSLESCTFAHANQK